VLSTRGDIDVTVKLQAAKSGTQGIQKLLQAHTGLLDDALESALFER
jgi:hypothetical protein